jgi:hypothetical protein
MIGLTILTAALSAVFSIAAPSAGSPEKVSYDEAAIKPYSLPDPLLTLSGRPVRTVRRWARRRRPEILEQFTREMFGESPKLPRRTLFHVLEESSSALGSKATRRQVSISFDGEWTDSLVLLIYTPNGLDEPAPCFLGVNFWGNWTVSTDPAIFKPSAARLQGYGNKQIRPDRGSSQSRWPLEEIISRGYAVATFYRGDIDPDFDDGFKNGVHGVLDKGKERDAESWGTVAAWAWGLRLCLDYLEKDPDIDEGKVAVFGHSRLGKTALWAGATDRRFAMVISNCSGCSGAAISRRRIGETVDIINYKFPHWFCTNYRKYNCREWDLPFDEHELIALAAPRPVYVASASEDNWADPKGEYLSLVGASPVYALYGYEGFTSYVPPGIEQPVVTGRMGYHIRRGKHDIALYDWLRYLDFADRFLK